MKIHKIQNFNIWYDRSSKSWLVQQIDELGKIVQTINGYKGTVHSSKTDAFKYVEKLVSNV
jgi:hypothetical protein